MALIVQNAELEDLAAFSGDQIAQIYNALDCAVTMEVFEVTQPLLTPETKKVYNLSRRLQGPVLEMTLRGLRVDEQQRRRVLASFERKAQKVRAGFDELVEEGIGVPCNPMSPTQLKHLFYGVLGLPEVRKKSSSTGKFIASVDEEALERCALYLRAVPLVRHVLVLRELNKKISMLKTGIDSDGRLRTNINIAGTVTGRMASAKSDFGTGRNLMNIEDELRSIFIPDPGKVFVNLDLEQADSRNIGAACWNYFLKTHNAAFAGAYLDACESGDLHTTVASMVWTTLAWPEELRAKRALAETPMPDGLIPRKASKALGHGSNYLGQPRTMSSNTAIALHLVEAFQRDYFTTFPAIPLLHKRTLTLLRQRKPIKTIWGRVRQFYGNVNDPKTQRDAVAFTGQSPTADELNHGLINMFHLPSVDLLIQVHDSALAQVPEASLDKSVPRMISAMEVPLELEGGREFIVPVEARVGRNWGNKSGDNPRGLEKW